MKIKERFDKDKLYFTSDLHFYHDNINKYCNRPWGDSKTADPMLIQNWNETVPKDGIVFLAGDVAYTSNIVWIQNLISKLNGTIYLVLGNHDYQNRWDRAVVKDIFGNRVMDTASIIVEDKELEEGYTKFFISHYPHMFWERGSFHLHGHVHSGPKSEANEKVPFHPMRYDVGVDNNNYRPISYEELKVIFTKYSMK